MSTERGTACAVRSDTLRRPETPLRPRLPVTTSAAPNVRAAAPRRGGEARDVVHHREGSSLANAPTGVSGTGTTAIPLPRTALQILAIDLATETLPALALGASRPSRPLMGLTVRAIRDSDPSAVHLLRHAVRGLQDLARQRVGVLGSRLSTARLMGYAVTTISGSPRRRASIAPSAAGATSSRSASIAAMTDAEPAPAARDS
jgi:hypothetical protein